MYLKNSVEYSLAYFAFRTHAGHAKGKGVGFDFTFEEWCEWWIDHLGPDWLGKRGKSRGQYVMARFEDKGPYASWNVECIKHEQNIRNGYMYRIAKGKAILTEAEIREIYLAPKSAPEIARAYRIRDGLVRNIKYRKRYSQVTEGLGEAPIVWLKKPKNHE